MDDELRKKFEKKAQEALLTTKELMAECQDAGYVLRCEVARERCGVFLELARRMGGAHFSNNSDEEGTFIDIKAIRFEPTPEDPLKHIILPSFIPSIDGQEINVLGIWVSDNLDPYTQNSGTYSMLSDPTISEKGRETRIALLNPLPNSALVDNPLVHIAEHGGTFSISPAGLQLVGAHIDRSFPIGNALGQTLQFLGEAFTSERDVFRDNLFPRGGDNFFRLSLNRAAVGLKKRALFDQ